VVSFTLLPLPPGKFLLYPVDRSRLGRGGYIQFKNVSCLKINAFLCKETRQLPGFTEYYVLGVKLLKIVWTSVTLVLFSVYHWGGEGARAENENDDLSCVTWQSKEPNLVVGLRLCASRGRILWFVGSRLPIMVRGRLCPVSWSFYPLCSFPRGYWRSGMAPVLSP
jgi:hypothetical protein